MLRLSEPPGPGPRSERIPAPASQRCGDLRRVHRHPGKRHLPPRAPLPG